MDYKPENMEQGSDDATSDDDGAKCLEEEQGSDDATSDEKWLQAVQTEEQLSEKYHENYKGIFTLIQKLKIIDGPNEERTELQKQAIASLRRLAASDIAQSLTHDIQKLSLQGTKKLTIFNYQYYYYFN